MCKCASFNTNLSSMKINWLLSHTQAPNNPGGLTTLYVKSWLSCSIALWFYYYLFFVFTDRMSEKISNSAPGTPSKSEKPSTPKKKLKKKQPDDKLSVSLSNLRFQVKSFLKQTITYWWYKSPIECELKTNFPCNSSTTLINLHCFRVQKPTKDPKECLRQPT